MTDYYIFRHGDTIETGNFWLRIFGRNYDSHKITILPKAIPALKNIGKFLKSVSTNANFCSPYPRCLESAEIVSSISKKTFKVDERLRELESNGEKFEDFRERIKSFLDDIEEKKYSAVAICTHGAGIAAIKYLKTKGKFYFFQVVDYPPPGNLLIIKDGKASKINFNSSH
jgi:broad specificity phosphatase PhoE